MCKPSNGGNFVSNSMNYYIINTCSIDYFLLIIFLLYDKNDQNKSIFDDTFIMDIIQYISLNDWNIARLKWIEYNQIPKKIICQKNNIVYNCFLSEYESFYKTISTFQSFTWFCKCPSKHCKLNVMTKQNSSAFKLMLCINLIFFN